MRRLQHEAFQDEISIGHVEMAVTLRDPVGGSCTGTGTARDSRVDDEKDIKHMVAYADDANLDGGCVDVTFEPIDVKNTVTFQTFCYIGRLTDNEPGTP